MSGDMMVTVMVLLGVLYASIILCLGYNLTVKFTCGRTIKESASPEANLFLPPSKGKVWGFVAELLFSAALCWCPLA